MPCGPAELPSFPGVDVQRTGKVVATIGVRELVTADERFRPKGSSVADLWESVNRLVWNTPRYSESTRQNHIRTRELSRSLPSHPSPGEALGWVESLRQAGMADSTLYLHRKTMRTLYRWGQDLGLVLGNPFAVAALRKPRPSPHHIPMIADYWPVLLAACEDERERAFLGCLRFLAVRREEALGFQRRDFRRERGGWVADVRRARPDPAKLEGRPLKTESSYRVLPIPGVLVELLRPILQADPEIRAGLGGGAVVRVPWIFPYRDNGLDRLARRLRAAAPLAFRPGKIWHSFRDTTAAELHEAGADIGRIRDVLGHTSELVTREHYVGIIGRRVRADAFDGVWKSPGRGGAPPGGKSERPRAATRDRSDPTKAVQPKRGRQQWKGTAEGKRRSDSRQLTLPTGIVVATPRPRRRRP